MRKYKVCRDACFVCTTPYQILGAIAIVQDKKIDADLYIFREFKGCDEVAIKLGSSGIFKNVKTIKNVTYRNKSRVHFFFDFLFAEIIYKEYLQDSVCYNYFYSTTSNRRLLLFKYVLTKRNPDIKYVYYEDGLAMYAKGVPLLTHDTPRFVKMLEFSLRRKFLSPISSEFLCEFPSLVELPDEVCNIPINKMPVMDFKLNRKLLCKAFSYDVNDEINEKILFFDEFRGYENEKRKLGDIDKILEVTYEMCSNDMIYKSHPRSFYEVHTSAKKYKNQIVPMEIIYTTMDNLDKRILIANLSTALFTPKILFDVEPYVISIHRIISSAFNESVLEPIYLKFESIYSDKSKICAPKTIEQFRLCLQKMVEVANL